MRKVIYLSDFSLPNKSAYAVHVIKMCEAFASNGLSTQLIVNNINTNFHSIKKNYNIDYNFTILGLQKFKKNNTFVRIINAIKILNILKKKKPNLIISRNIIASLILALFNIKNILEIHTEINGFTKIIFFFIYKIINKNNLKFIFIHKKLNDYFALKKKHYIVLDDAVKIEDFSKTIKKIKKNKKKKFIYTGSFVNGKGVKIIIQLAKIFKNHDFILYGNIDTMSDDNLTKCRLAKNINLNEYTSYNKILSILMNADYLLMPYERKIGVLIPNLDVSKYISPLKMFEYLAAKKIIFATKQPSYKHILKDNFNCIILQLNDLQNWKKRISAVINYPLKYKSLKMNAFKTAKNYTWKNRCLIIDNFFNKDEK
jgi:glycosyltransferase involved in cell wall biosynthesis